MRLQGYIHAIRWQCFLCRIWQRIQTPEWPVLRDADDSSQDAGRTSICSLAQTFSLLGVPALTVRPSWNHHGPKSAECHHHGNIMAGSRDSLIQCRVEQPGVVD